MFRKRNHTQYAMDAADAAAGHFQQGAQALGQSKDEVVKEFENLIGAGEAMLRSTTSASGAALSDARDKFSARLKDAQDFYNQVSDAAIERGRKAATATDDYVRANPWPAIGIAAGVAFVVGALASRR